MQLRAGVRRTSEAAAAKRDSWHSEIKSIFLHQKIGRRFGRAEKRVFCVIDAHRFGDARFVFMFRLNFPAFRQFPQRQSIWRVAVDFVC